MAPPSEKLANSLGALKQLQDRGAVAIRSVDLSRTHRERLLKNGFLQEVIKGWYISIRPNDGAGECTAWHASFWAFCAAYLRERFGAEWSLAPEQSVLLHAGNHAVPRQLMVRSPKARNRATALPHETSVFDVRAALPSDRDTEERDGLRLFSLPAALIACPPGFFENNPVDARAGLATVRDASEVLPRLLEGGHSTIAGRLAGAFRNIGRDRIADDILKAMRGAGYTVREQDPFASRIDFDLPRREVSPRAGRIRFLWPRMRGPVIERFPAPPGRPNDIDACMKRVQEAYVTDAYPSQSIERLRCGIRNSDGDEQDREHRNGLAARGRLGTAPPPEGDH